MRFRTYIDLFWVAAGMLFAGFACADDPPQASAPTILVTDMGQGNNAKIIRMLLKKNGITNVTLVELADVADLAGIDILIIGVGASTKGLGAAGLNVDKELERASKLLAAAKQKSIKTVGAHVGGEARRGELSDKLNELVMLESERFVVWKEGDKDGFFSRLAATKLGGDPDEETLFEVFRVVDSKMDVGTALNEMIESPQ